jgi:hypothetical protein
VCARDVFRGGGHGVPIAHQGGRKKFVAGAEIGKKGKREKFRSILDLKCSIFLTKFVNFL